MSSAILNMTDLMHRVDDDRELLAELFFIFKTVFPAHLERLSDAVARNENKQVESESHALKGMLLNLSAPPCRRCGECVGANGPRTPQPRHGPSLC